MQKVVLRLFDSGFAFVVNIAEPDDLGGQSLIRITASLIFVPVQAGKLRLIRLFNIGDIEAFVNLLYRLVVKFFGNRDKSLAGYFAFLIFVTGI